MTGDGLAGPKAGDTEGPAASGGVLDPGSGLRSPVIQLDRHRRPASAADAAGRDQDPDAATLLRVLVIDDEEEDFLIVRELLARAQHGRFRVEHAADAEVGLDRLLSGRCDVALVDYRLAGQDGLSLTRLAVRRGAAAPVIVMSGLGVPDLAVDAIAAGAADFLEKEELEVERLERAIRLSLARQRRDAPRDRSRRPEPPAGLPGPALFADRLRHEAARARRHATLTAVMILELDRLGKVDRRLGPAAGEHLLQLTGERLQRHLRETDMVAWLRQGVLGIIAERLGRAEHAALVAQKLLAAAAAPVASGEEAVAVTPCLGVALLPADGTDAPTLLGRAEAAAARARALGGNRFCLHDERLDGAVREQALRAAALRRAIDADALSVHYQPQVTLCSAELGLAALVRWRHDAPDVIEGERLLDLAEAAGLIEPLTDRLLAAACRQARRWRDAGLPRLHVAVPFLSRRQLAWGALPLRLEGHLAAAGIPPECLEVEIDERLLLGEWEAQGRILAELRALGIRLAVAGFGTGPTSLALLRDVPLTTVKLARAMLHGIPEDRHRLLLAGAVIQLARQLGLRLVAEGIESQAQLQLLRAQGCDAVQAFISCPPLPADACTDWLRQAAHRA
jgi:diguanylate cyclase (GGDEF)-like protein